MPPKPSSPFANIRNVPGEKWPGDKGPGDTRPFLCIPYWEAPRVPGDPVDIGVFRPLPGNVTSWDCHGIHASPYKPGNALQVSVDVRNSGPGNATAVATVVVYWANPTIGFAKPTFFGATSVAVPPFRDPFQPIFVTTPTLTAVIPATAPNHICLLALVTHSLDKAGTVADPMGDRHWAQRNLTAASANAKQPLNFPFLIANPFATEEKFELRIHVLGGPALELVALRMRAEPSEAWPHFQLVDERGKPVTDWASEASTGLALGSHQGRKYSLMLKVGPLPSHQVAAIEAVLYLTKERQAPVGSLGIVVGGPDIEALEEPLTQTDKDVQYPKHPKKDRAPSATDLSEDKTRKKKRRATNRRLDRHPG